MMRRGIVALVGCVVLIAAPVFAARRVASGGGQANSNESQDVVNISGRIMSSHCAPVAGVAVIFRDSTGRMPLQTDTVVSDKKGAFSFPSRRSAEYSVFITVPNVRPDKSILLIAITRFIEGSDVSLGNVVVGLSPKNEPVARLAGPVQIKDLQRTQSSAGSTMPISPLIAGVYRACDAEHNEYCEHNALHILLNNGEDLLAPASKDRISGEGQVGVESPLISEDRRVVGWLAEYDECCQSYPISLELVVYRPGKPLREFTGDGRGIFEWHLLDEGMQAAFYQDFTHGNSVPHYELRDIETGKLIDQWDGDGDRKSPAWVNLFAASNSATTPAPPLVLPGQIEASAELVARNRIGGAEPEYPVEAKKAGIQGTVVVHVSISESGRVGSLYASGPRLLRMAAMNAVLTWTYKPFMLNGRPVKVWTQINVVFKLNH